MSHRIWDPRNRSALTRNGSLGVRRRFCLIRAFVMAAVGLSKIDTKLGLEWVKYKFELIGCEGKTGADLLTFLYIHLMVIPVISISW